MLLRGLLLGLAIAAPVGPIGVLCIRQTLTFGWLKGFISGLGAATADGMYGCIAGFSLSAIANFLLKYQIWLRLVGGVFLCYLGIKTLFQARIKHNKNHQVKDMSLISTYLSTFCLTLSNPATILTFAALFSGVGSFSTNNNYFSAMMLVTGVFLGSGFWWLFLCSLVSLIGNKLALTNLQWINRISGVIIIAFGLVALSSLV